MLHRLLSWGGGGVGYFSLAESGSAEGTQKRRQLSEEEGMDKNVSGYVFRGTRVNGTTDEIIQHKIAHNVTGLPPCSNCNMSIAFSNAQECTKETHDEANMIPLLSDLTYTTDDDGNTGVKGKEFIVDSEHPAGQQFLLHAKNMHEDSTQVQESNFSVFFYDEEGELIACSFLQPIVSDKDEELAAEILAMFTADLDGNMVDSISSEIEDVLNSNATPIGEGGNSAGSSMFSFLPMIVVSAAACVFFSS